MPLSARSWCWVHGSHAESNWSRQGLPIYSRAIMTYRRRECIIVGNRIDADIAPAEAAGMATIQFRSGR